jgi:hypothetical protein
MPMLRRSNRKKKYGAEICDAVVLYGARLKLARWSDVGRARRTK